MCAQSLAAIIPLIMHKVNSDSSSVEKCIDMLAQSVHISLYSKAMYGNKRKYLYVVEFINMWENGLLSNQYT